MNGGTMVRKKLLIWTLVALIAFAATIVAQAPQGQPGQGAGQRGPGGGGGRGGGGGAPAIKMVKPGLYMVTGAGGNSVVRVTNDGIVVVDTKNPGEANFNG